MLKETGYKEKFSLVDAWLPEIVQAVKRDLKQEHLKIDRAFCKKYFLGKGAAHVSVEEMVAAYRQDIAEGNVGLGEFIASRWLLKHTDLYGYFESKLQSINPDFEMLEELPESVAWPWMREAVAQFGAVPTYLFCVLNFVVFPAAVFAELRELAEREEKASVASEEQKDQESLEGMRRKHERAQAALMDKYEKKLRGLERKYLHDTEALKKQVVQLQQKLAAQACPL